MKTLAIRGTYEEIMMLRREALKGSGVKQPQLTDDRRMRDFIAVSGQSLSELFSFSKLPFQNPTFLTESSEDARGRWRLDIPLIDCSSTGINADLDGSDNPTSVDITQGDDARAATSLAVNFEDREEPPRKKSKRVHYIRDDAE